jgi:polysaccharide export outer membrane protein
MANAWGNIYLMICKMQGAFHPLAYRSSWLLMFVLLVTPAVFSQQSHQVESKPLREEAASDINDRISQLAVASETKQTDYVIGNGDLLTIEVFDVPELSRDVRVGETGFISLPLLPEKVRAAGLTASQLQNELAELLRTNQLVSKPQVNITLKERQSQPITVIGAVKNPMVYQALRQTTLLEVLSQAGGMASDAGNIVIVTRAHPVSVASGDAQTQDAAESQTFTIRLSDLLDTGDPRFNIPLQGGDVITVPHAGIVYVVGAVGRPGGFVMQNDRDLMTTLKALSLAGGTTQYAKLNEAVILRRNPDTGKTQQIPVDLKKILHQKAEDKTLEASDVLFIPDSSGKRALHRAGDVALSLTTGVAIYRAGQM